MAGPALREAFPVGHFLQVEEDKGVHRNHGYTGSISMCVRSITEPQ